MMVLLPLHVPVLQVQAPFGRGVAVLDVFSPVLDKLFEGHYLFGVGVVLFSVAVGHRHRRVICRDQNSVLVLQFSRSFYRVNPERPLYSLYIYRSNEKMASTYERYI